jgi:hypothetical protein
MTNASKVAGYFCFYSGFKDNHLAKVVQCNKLLLFIINVKKYDF